ncbi:uncharacterized protein LOC107883900 [Acyrthosiphon pisum]|uniref:Tudor domain-containing protein n=1 Tax=Acyrthosiphon pisum TaxID=7029 RepID=A0A8R2H5Z9_ACYPI|nr:uncharacterized protein LOC107883900 [Acyrthosiphon pisum]|eukprot:XP_016660322.1 PREDICTED: uncharacterized protein LOC107883900 [Acyrthosiphon pisum]
MFVAPGICWIFKLNSWSKSVHRPGRAVKIGLSDLKDIRTTEQIKNMFRTFCDVEKPFVIEFDENSKNCLQNVKLKDIENGTYIDSKYILKYISIQSEDSIEKPQNITKNETLSINSPELEVISNIELRTKKNNDSNKWRNGDHVEFLSGCNVDEIFVRNIRLYEEFKNVLDQLKGENSEKYKPVPVKANDYVAVYSTKNNGGIYRGWIMESNFDNANNAVKCILIDIGQIEMIPSKNIFLLPTYVSLNNLPIMVRRVALGGLHKILNPAIRLFLDSLRGKTYIMEYKAYSGEGRKPKVILKKLENSVSLNDEIQKIFKNESFPLEIIS